ncbi:hypothetical protein [Vibrio sp. D431a]|uniref:hypothetical protein n=1 Tax=Vibrio sp. D431a TaxID=2837388 RepID=UPI002555419A|nr:hypothetical protein [Vibrio sp. D431a]MDK9790095.1 hypothetical protein [Vibrio sp. D431a]
MTVSLPSFVTKRLNEKNLDLLAVVRELNDAFSAAGYSLDLSILTTVTWSNIPKSYGIHGACFLLDSEEIAIVIDERYKGEGMWNELRQLVAHECVHFAQYQAYLSERDEFYLDRGKVNKSIGHSKGHGEFFFEVAHKVNEVDPSLVIHGRHQGYEDYSSLASKMNVFSVSFQRDVYVDGFEHPELRVFEAAFAAQNVDLEALRSSIENMYGSAAISFTHYETLSPVAEGLPALNASSQIPSGNAYLADYSKVLDKIKGHSTTELILRSDVRAESGKKVDLIVAKSRNGALVGFHGSHPINLYKFADDVVPFLGGSISEICHFVTENLNATKTHKLTKTGGIRKNQKPSGHNIDFINALVSHKTTSCINKLEEAEIFSRYIESSFSGNLTGLDKDNHSYDLIKHVVKHLSSFPVVGEKILGTGAAKRILEIINKDCKYVPIEVQERIMGGWEALNLNSVGSLLKELSSSIDSLELGETDLSEIFRIVDDVHFKFGDIRHCSSEDFLRDALKRSGYKGDLTDDLMSWEPDYEWINERFDANSKNMLASAVAAGWGTKGEVEELFGTVFKAKYRANVNKPTLSFGDLLQSSAQLSLDLKKHNLKQEANLTSQMSLGF